MFQKSQPAASSDIIRIGSNAYFDKNLALIDPPLVRF